MIFFLNLCEIHWHQHQRLLKNIVSKKCYLKLYDKVRPNQGKKCSLMELTHLDVLGMLLAKINNF